jgi:hypothetical protein
MQNRAYERGSTSGIDILREVAANGRETTDGDIKQLLGGLYQSTTLGRNKKPNPWDPVSGPKVDRPLEVGTPVRLLMRTYIFRKGSRQKAFTDEVFTVDRVSRHNPNAYYLVDDDGERITGKIYRRQLQELTSRPDRWEVRVLRRRKSRKKGRKGQLELLVEWVGFPGRAPEWIPASDASGQL